jgi:hypothetical protein
VFAVNTSKSTSFTAWGLTEIQRVNIPPITRMGGIWFTSIILSRNVHYLTNLAVDRRMETMIVSWGQSEDRQAGIIERKSLVRVRRDAEKIGYIEFISLYPNFCNLQTSMTRSGRQKMIPEFLGQIGCLIDCEPGICCATDPCRVINILDWANAVFEFSVVDNIALEHKLNTRRRIMSHR